MFVTAEDPDFDRVVNQLRTDRVSMVDVLGSAEPTAARQRLVKVTRQESRESGIPIYVALVDDIPGERTDGANAYAQRLHTVLGSGVFVVASTDSIVTVNAWGTPFSTTWVSLATSSGSDAVEQEFADLQVPGYGLPKVVEAEVAVRSVAGMDGWEPAETQPRYPATIPADEVGEVARYAASLTSKAAWRPWIDTSDWDDDRISQTTNWLWAIGAFVVSLFGLVRLLRRWPQRRTLRYSPVQVDVERRLAAEQVDALAADLEKLARSSRTVADQERWDLALAAQDAARPLLDSPDAADLVGARTLAATGSRDVRIARKGQGTPYRCCFFDPRHGEATSVGSWRLGQGQVELPVCAACQHDVDRGSNPETMVLPAGAGRQRPWFEGDDVWARTGYGTLTSTYARDVLARRSGSKR